MANHNDTITAPATGPGGALAVIRVSGPDSILIADRIFTPASGAKLSGAAGYTLHYGTVEQDGEVVDEVVLSLFRAPRSYTGEDMVEISCHGSRYIQQRIVNLLIAGGARHADPGEFTIRAFLSGKLDLAQAEAVADLIASSDRAQHSLAMEQMRGGYSSALAGLRGELVTLASLLELELDFSEEDVQFADRSRLRSLARGIARELDSLAESFSLGNVIKEGVPAAIVGRPNTGKSTLLNALVKEERAMVSEIAGTTRDRIEERVNIDGVTFRFIDTAGIRATEDVLEQMGIGRTMETIGKARIVLLLVDATSATNDDILAQAAELGLREGQRLLVILNKIDNLSGRDVSELCAHAADRLSALYGYGTGCIAISARTGENIDALTRWLRDSVDTDALYSGSVIVSNTRHYEALVRSREALERVLAGLGADGCIDPMGTAASSNEGTFSGGLSSDLLAEDIREALHYLGTITGEVTTDELLGTIFSRFCIGK